MPSKSLNRKFRRLTGSRVYSEKIKASWVALTTQLAFDVRMKGILSQASLHKDRGLATTDFALAFQR
jgi:hypothetical protein